MGLCPELLELTCRRRWALVQVVYRLPQALRTKVSAVGRGQECFWTTTGPKRQCWAPGQRGSELFLPCVARAGPGPARYGQRDGQRVHAQRGRLGQSQKRRDTPEEGSRLSPRPRLRDLGLDPLLRRLELPHGLVGALPAHHEHFRDHERVRLVARLLELLPRRPPQDNVPGLAVLVGPVEVAGGAQAVAVERQRLGRRRPLPEAAEQARCRRASAARAVA